MEGAAIDTQPAVRMVDLTRRFGQTVVVDGIDLEIPVGSVVGVVGPSVTHGIALLQDLMLRGGVTEPWHLAM